MHAYTTHTSSVQGQGMEQTLPAAKELLHAHTHPQVHAAARTQPPQPPGCPPLPTWLAMVPKRARCVGRRGRQKVGVEERENRVGRGNIYTVRAAAQLVNSGCQMIDRHPAAYSLLSIVSWRL